MNGTQKQIDESWGKALQNLRDVDRREYKEDRQNMKRDIKENTRDIKSLRECFHDVDNRLVEISSGVVAIKDHNSTIMNMLNKNINDLKEEGINTKEELKEEQRVIKSEVKADRLKLYAILGGLAVISFLAPYFWDLFPKT